MSEDIVHFFSLHMESEAAEDLRTRLISFANANPEAVEHQTNRFAFSDTLAVQFIDLAEGISGDHSMVGLSLENPHDIIMIQPFLDTIYTPVQISSKTGGDLVIIPAAAEDEFGNADPATGVYSVSQLGAMSIEGLLTAFKSDYTEEDDGDVSLINNASYDPEADLFADIESTEDEVVRGQYEYIFTPSNISSDHIFFQIFGCETYQAYDDGETAIYKDEDRSIRLSAYRVDYQDGQYWTLNTFIPDQGAIREAKLTDRIVRKIASETTGWRVFAVISADDLGETTTAQEYVLRNDQLSEGQFRNFVAPE